MSIVLTQLVPKNAFPVFFSDQTIRVDFNMKLYNNTIIYVSDLFNEKRYGKP